MTSELRPAVEVWRKAVHDYGGASIEGTEAEYRAALAARGLEVRKIGESE